MAHHPDPDDPAVQDRNWAELLQELRVTQTGVQLLAGFLLTVPFSNRFGVLDGLARGVYLAVFCGALLSTALLVAPVAFHRVLFRRRQRRWLIETANVCARAGLGTLALTTCGILFLVVDTVLSRPAALGFAVAAVLCFALLWLVLPVVAAGPSDDELREARATRPADAEEGRRR
jgi:hypothetical protein